ncbi:MAG: hypothetical protein J6B75_04805 [Ruminococcus sp.]|nr:hypothetical protein [Ruminococcus sp.]
MKKFIMTAILSAAVMSLTSCSFNMKTQGEFGNADVDGDGEMTAGDLDEFGNYLLGTYSEEEYSLINDYDLAGRFDLNLDGSADVFDMVLMRQAAVSGENRETVSWSVDDVPLADGFDKILNDEYVITSPEELSELTEILYSGTEKDGIWANYDEAFFSDKSLLIKPIMQSFYRSDKVIYNISSVYYEGDDIVIHCNENYDTKTDYTGEQLVNTPLLAQVSVPKDRNGMTPRWEIKKLNYDRLIDFILEEGKNDQPEIDEYDTFDFTSPDGSQTFSVSQEVTKYPDKDCETTLRFCSVFKGTNELEKVRICVPDEIYRPFSDEKNYEVVWGESGVTFKFTADKEYSYTFDYVDKFPRTQTVTVDHTGKVYPGISSVDVIGDYAGDMQRVGVVIVRAAYDEVPRDRGYKILGSPIGFDIADDVENPTAVLHYDESLLNGSEENLRLFGYAPKVDKFTHYNIAIDTENNTVTMPAHNGIYFLAEVQ